MTRLACLAATLVFGMIAPSAAQDAKPIYDFRARTFELAFDPARFFSGQFGPEMSVRYLGDGYHYPVYAIAVEKGGERLVARMVRPSSPYKGVPAKARTRGQEWFATITQASPQSDDALLRLFDTGLEWLEADIRKCPAAMAHLATGQNLRFSAPMDPNRLAELMLHPDMVSFETGGYYSRSRYNGWLKPGSPGAWAHEFAESLETCWKPSTATVPWRVAKK